MDAHDKESTQQQAVEKLLRRALRRSPAAGPDACLDGNLLAAYYEGSLGSVEREEVENHLAACSRCQEVLASLALSEPVPSEELEVAALPAAATAQAAPIYAAARIATPQSELPAEAMAPHVSAAKLSREKRARFAFPLQWLAPAASIAAVALFWIAVGPPIEQTQIAKLALQKQAPAVVALDQTRQSSATSADRENESSVATATGAPATPPRVSAKRPSRPSDTEALSAGAGGVSKGEASAVVAGERGEEKAKVAERATSMARLALPAPANAPAPAPPAGVSGGRLDDRRRAEPVSESATKAAATSVPEPQKQTAQQTAVQGQVGGVTPSSEVGVQSNLRAGDARFGAMRKAAAIAPRIVTTPEAGVLWRIGAAGRIEHSIDGGQSWQVQESGTVADLVAGSAPSTKVCWIVGAEGIILRATDGEHWEKIAPPETPVPVAWARVSATDALQAVITSVEGKRFATADGGKTWKSQ